MEHKGPKPPPQVASLLALAGAMAGDGGLPDLPPGPAPVPDKTVRKYEPDEEVTIGDVRYVAGMGGNLKRKFPKLKKKKRRKKGILNEQEAGEKPPHDEAKAEEERVPEGATGAAAAGLSVGEAAETEAATERERDEDGEQIVGAGEDPAEAETEAPAGQAEEPPGGKT